MIFSFVNLGTTFYDKNKLDYETTKVCGRLIPVIRTSRNKKRTILDHTISHLVPATLLAGGAKIHDL
jgi:hypothetical protein